MFDYKVVFAQQLEELMEKVRESGRDNWIPQGGISRGALYEGLFSKKFFFQAMIRNSSED